MAFVINLLPVMEEEVHRQRRCVSLRGERVLHPPPGATTNDHSPSNKRWSMITTPTASSRLNQQLTHSDDFISADVSVILAKPAS